MADSEIKIFDKDVSVVNLASRSWDSKEHPVHVAITGEHAHTHEGVRFKGIVSADLSAGAEAYISFATGSKSAEFHFDATFALEGEYDFWEGGTIVGGTAVPPINTSFLAIHSAITQECVLTAGPTLSGATVKMPAPVKLGSGKNAGGDTDDVWLFEANSRYSLRVGSAVNNNIVTLESWWVEH